LDITKALENFDGFWASLKKDGLEVDVLVLSAAVAGQLSLKAGWMKTWGAFEGNVLGNLRMTEEFLAQGPRTGKVSSLHPITLESYIKLILCSRHLSISQQHLRI